MQGCKHLTQTLGFTALLVLMTIQATGVDSLPQGFFPFRHPASLLRPEAGAEPQSGVERLHETRGLLGFFVRPKDAGQAAAIALPPGVLSEQSAADVPQRLVPGPRRHFSTAFFTDYSQNGRYPNEYLFPRFRQPKHQFSGTVARVRGCEDGSCLPFLYRKFPHELRSLCDKFSSAGRQLQDFLTAYHNIYQRHIPPWLAQEPRTTSQGVLDVRVSPPLSDGIDYLLSFVEQNSIDRSSQGSLPLTDTPIEENDTDHQETLYNWHDVYRYCNNLYHPNDLSGSISPNDLTELNKIKRSLRKMRDIPQQPAVESNVAHSIENTDLIHDEVFPFLAESVFPLLVRISVTAHFLDELIDSLEVATSFPIRNSIRNMYQKMASSPYGPLVKVLRLVYDFGISLIPAWSESNISEYTDTVSSGYLETTVEEVFMESDTKQPRSPFRLWPKRSKRSDVSEEEKKVNLLIGPLEYITYITSWVDTGMTRAKSIDAFGTLDHFLKEAQHFTKKLSALDVPPPLDKFLKFAEVILDHIAPKEKRTKRYLPLTNDGISAQRKKPVAN